jgi:hypothetical protein
MSRSSLLPLLLGLACTMPAAAQGPAPKVPLLFSHRPKEDTATPAFLLRPNLEQEIFVFVRNIDNRPREVMVRLFHGKAVALTSARVTIPNDGLPFRVDLTRPVEPVKPGEAPKPADTTKPIEQTAPLVFALADERDRPLGDPVPVEVARPGRYLEVPTVRVLPPSRENPLSRLVVRVRVKESFLGKCRVDLVLRPERIPGLVAGGKKKGIYGGTLLGVKGDELFLMAEGLVLEGSVRRRGPVYLTVDGIDRAFTFFATFPPEGTATAPVEVTKPGLFLDVPEYASPKEPLPVKVEVDNAPRDARILLSVKGLAVVEQGRRLLLEDRYAEIAEFAGDRAQRLWFGPGPAGGVLFKSEVRDWAAVLRDLSGTHGRATLRLQMFDAKNELMEVRDNRTGDVAVAATVERVVLLDDQPAEGVRFVNPPEAAYPGEPLRLQATAADPPTDFAQVSFFAGKPLPDGKLPPGTEPSPGALDPVKKIWTGEVYVPRDRRDPIEVSIQFVKKAGPAKFATLRLPLGDPADRKKASVRGRVVEGDRPQADVPVRLYDARAQQKGETRTNERGEFAFTKLDPGRYRLTAAKTVSATRGQRDVELTEGEQKVLTPKEEIKLYR